MKSVPRLLLSTSPLLFSLVSQRPPFPVGERVRCVTRPNNGCKRNAYRRPLNIEKIKIIRL